MPPNNTKNAKNAQKNCKNHTKNAKHDISGITDILPGVSPYWLSPITSFHHVGYPRARAPLQTTLATCDLSVNVPQPLTLRGSANQTPSQSSRSEVPGTLGRCRASSPNLHGDPRRHAVAHRESATPCQGTCRSVTHRDVKPEHDSNDETPDYDSGFTNFEFSQPVFQYRWKMPHFHTDCLACTKFD
jgi:hypothetical protein